MGVEDTEAFIWVARTESFAEAGRKLGVPRSTLSRQVQRLEARLQVRLLQRTTRYVGLTEAGRTYFTRCAPAVDAIAEAEREMRSHLDGPRGELTVAMPFDAARDLVGPLLPAFHRRYPDVALRLRVDARRVNIVTEGIDVALRGGRLDDSSLISKLLFRSHLGLYASPGYLKARGTPKNLEDLDGHERLSFAGPPGGWPVPDADGNIQRMPTDGWLVINEWVTLTRSVVAGSGIAFLIDTAARPHLASGSLVRVLPDVEIDGGGLYAVYPSAQHLSAKVRAFVDFLANELGPVPSLTP